MVMMGNSTRQSKATTTTAPNQNGYINAIQSILQTNQIQQQNQLAQQNAMQSQLLSLQKGQTNKANQSRQDEMLVSSETNANNYTSLLKQLMDLSARNAALRNRMFS